MGGGFERGELGKGDSCNVVTFAVMGDGERETEEWDGKVGFD